MAGESRPVISTLERIGSTFLNRCTQLAARDFHDVLGLASSRKSLREVATTLAPRSCVIDGFVVSQQGSPAMSVQVSTGMAMILNSGAAGVVGTPQKNVDSNYKIVNKRTASSTIALAVSHATLERFDLIEIAPAASAATETDESGLVDTFDTTLLKFLPSGGSQITMRHGEPDVFVNQGTPGAGVPTPTAGRLAVAMVRVRASVTTITTKDIFDCRIFMQELLSGGPGRHLDFLDVFELSVNVPANIASSASAQNMVVKAQVRAGGIPGACDTQSLSISCKIATSSVANDLFDNLTRTNILSGTHGFEWLYFYIVTKDDKGLRFSRGQNFDGDAVKMCGALVISHVAPIDSGSMEPSDILTLPPCYGAGSVTAGTGHAICIGAAPYGTNLQYFSNGMRQLDGKAQIVYESFFGVPVTPATWTYTAESNVGTDMYDGNIKTTIDRSNAGCLRGATHFNLALSIGFKTYATHAVPLELTFLAWDGTDTGSILGHEQAVSSTNVTASATHPKLFSVDNVPCVKERRLAGSGYTGLMVRCETRYNSGGSGGGLQNTATYNASMYLRGWSWPQGPVGYQLP